MAEVVTLVRGIVEPGREHEVIGPYREALKDGPPPDLEETFLLKGDGSELAILSVWHRRSTLTPCSPPARSPSRVVSSAGGR